MKHYCIATIRNWNIKLFQSKIKDWGNNWSLITNKDDLTLENIQKVNPEYIFFPHWGWKIPSEIYDNYECIGFHCTDLPDGRGGSPLQNLIIRGEKETIITAFKVGKELDAGDMYSKENVSLEGLAEEIYIRISKVIADMIQEIVTTNIIPSIQSAKANVLKFKRRTPEESEIPEQLSLDKLFDFIRMLSAEDYPGAFINYGGFRITFSEPALKVGKIVCNVQIMRDENVTRMSIKKKCPYCKGQKQYIDYVPKKPTNTIVPFPVKCDFCNETGVVDEM